MACIDFYTLSLFDRFSIFCASACPGRGYLSLSRKRIESIGSVSLILGMVLETRVYKLLIPLGGTPGALKF